MCAWTALVFDRWGAASGSKHLFCHIRSQTWRAVSAHRTFWWDTTWRTSAATQTELQLVRILFVSDAEFYKGCSNLLSQLPGLWRTPGTTAATWSPRAAATATDKMEGPSLDPSSLGMFQKLTNIISRCICLCLWRPLNLTFCLVFSAGYCFICWINKVCTKICSVVMNKTKLFGFLGSSLYLHRFHWIVVEVKLNSLHYPAASVLLCFMSPGPTEARRESDSSVLEGKVLNGCDEIKYLIRGDTKK